MAGVKISTLCHLAGMAPLTSCFVCVVRVEGRDNFVPSCATQVRDGMVVYSNCPDVNAARKAAMELLLSDHAGDCMAPCQSACPAGLDVPRMLRQIRAGQADQAAATARSALALPATLGRICPAPCQKACRRSRTDGAVTIRDLHRLAAESAPATSVPEGAASRPASPVGTPACDICGAAAAKSVAIVGAGPAGLAAAASLCNAGIRFAVFEKAGHAGGGLRDAILAVDEAASSVLDHEVQALLSHAVELKAGVELGKDISLQQLQTQFSAVLLAVGHIEPAQIQALGLAAGQRTGIAADRLTSATSVPGVFAAGAAAGHGGRLAVRAVASGKAAAASIIAYLAGRPSAQPKRPFTCHIAHPTEQELARMMALAKATATDQAADRREGFDAMATQAARCLQCDCAKAGSEASGQYPCRLRLYARQYGLTGAHHGGPRRDFDRIVGKMISYESGKCILCGRCVAIAAAGGDRPGLAITGRGFDARVAVPFGGDIDQALARTGRQCAAACPTGALIYVVP